MRFSVPRPPTPNARMPEIPKDDGGYNSLRKATKDARGRTPAAFPFEGEVKR